jgi:hypothetical protein
VTTVVERPVSEKQRRGRPPKPKTEPDAKVGSLVVPEHISKMVTELSDEAGCGSNADWLNQVGFFHWVEEEHLQMLDRKRERTKSQIKKRAADGPARPPWAN